MKFNIFIGLLLFILSILVSILISNKLTIKTKFYQQICDFNKKLEIEINYTKRSILEIIKSQDELIFKLLDDYFVKKIGLDDKYYTFLSQDEKKEIKNYLSVIGKYDDETQLNVLSAKMEYFRETLTEHKLKEEKYKPLYIKLGIFIGLILFILLL